VSHALYRKYRSKKLSDIVGQEHITDTLENALKSGKISHAYLFTGPKGVGKTSIARILAHEINNLPYTDESVHLDIIEIDAASNRRIDEIRDLREKIHIAPTSAKYKVYIIDEVHMLTKEAFNALLKTLEEPPAHVVFILATTEAHKLPDTIISRTQRFTFKPIEPDKATEHLRSIAKQEGMELDDESLALLAEHGHGSFRDSISLLDQVGNSKKKLVISDVENLIGIAPKQTIEGLFIACSTGDIAGVVEQLEALTTKGISPAQTAKQLAVRIRQEVISGSENTEFRNALKDLIDVPSSPDPLATLEIALFNFALHSTKPVPLEPKPEPTKQIETKQKEVKEKPVAEKTKSVEQEESEVKIELKSDISEWWPQLLAEVKKHNNTLYGVIRMATPEVDKSTLTLTFNFGFHAKKVTDSKTNEKLTSLLQEITGKKFKIVAAHNPKYKAKIVDEKPQTGEDNIETITSVFGGAEILDA